MVEDANGSGAPLPAVCDPRPSFWRVNASILPDGFSGAGRVNTQPYKRDGMESFLREFGPGAYHSAAEYEKAKAKAQTPEYAQTRKEHPRIERKLADLTRNHGARRAVYRGLWKVRIQAFITAMVVNVKRMIRLKQTSREIAVAAAGGIAVRLELG